MFGRGSIRRSGISSAPPAEPQGGRLSVALGLERLALIPFKAPMVTVLAALVIAALAIVGIQRILVDDSLSQMFGSNAVAFKQYDVLIGVSGDSLLLRESGHKRRVFVTDVQQSEGTRGPLSMFSARLAPPQ